MNLDGDVPHIICHCLFPLLLRDGNAIGEQAHRTRNKRESCPGILLLFIQGHGLGVESVLTKLDFYRNLSLESAVVNVYSNRRSLINDYPLVVFNGGDRQFARGRVFQGAGIANTDGEKGKPNLIGNRGQGTSRVVGPVSDHNHPTDVPLHLSVGGRNGGPDIGELAPRFHGLQIVMPDGDGQRSEFKQVQTESALQPFEPGHGLDAAGRSL